jgi:hypothetical protein
MNVRPYTGHPGQDRGEMEPPPDYLTDDRLDIFDAVLPGFQKPSARETSEEARQGAVSGFLAVCQLEGVEVAVARGRPRRDGYADVRLSAALSASHPGGSSGVERDGA